MIRELVPDSAQKRYTKLQNYTDATNNDEQVAQGLISLAQRD